MQEKSIKNVQNKPKKPRKKYSIIEHKHRSAAWGAGRSASAKGCRFKVSAAKQLIEAIQLQKFIDNPEKLPANFDVAHRKWRITIIQRAKELGMPKIHDGMAAKLINVYLKSIIICGGYHDTPQAGKIHPPVDRLLLASLAKDDIGGLKSFWNKSAQKGWSKFSSTEYEAVIKNIKRVSEDNPLWMIEDHWQGYQQ